MKFDTPRDQAVAMIATYDTPEPGRYEKHMVRLSRSWLRMIDSRHSVSGMITRLLDELSQPTPDDYGCGWDELRCKFTAWVSAEELLDND